ncbi:YCF48-related protein [Candidatus Neomarinimicrobiota bacterium]
MKYRIPHIPNSYVLVIMLLFAMIPKANGQWITLNSGTTTTLISVYFLNSNTGYVSGEVGTILKTTDGGENWVSLSSGAGNAFDAICFTNDSTGYAFGRAGLILKTTDAGNSWLNLNYSGDVAMFFSAYFTNDSTGYAVGQSNMQARIAKTADAGISWTTQAFDTLGWLESVHFPNANTGYAVGSTNNIGGTILKTTDGGNSWFTQTSGTPQNLTSVYFTDANTGYAVGSGGIILKTTNGGTTWVALNTGTGDRFYSVHFPIASTGYAVTGYPGDIGIYKTTNAGGSWSYQDPGTTESLESGFFVDADVGYIVGEGGIILKTVSGGIALGAETKDIIPSAFRLGQNYPNPFNPVTTIHYDLPQASEVSLIVYNILGQEVARLVEGDIEPGFHEIQWHGREFPSGLYLARIVTPEHSKSIKMLLLK